SHDNGFRQSDRGPPVGNHLLPARGRRDPCTRCAPGAVRPPWRQPSARPRLQAHLVMRIAIVAPLVTAIREPQLGGSQALVADLAMGLQTRGHEVHVYAASGAAVSTAAAKAWRALAPVDAILPDGVPVERIPWSASGGDGVIFAGRFSPEKGPEDAIAIAREAGVHIDLYGEPYDPEYARNHV